MAKCRDDLQLRCSSHLECLFNSIGSKIINRYSKEVQHMQSLAVLHSMTGKPLTQKQKPTYIAISSKQKTKETSRVIHSR